MSYLKTVFTNPGYVPEEFHLTHDELEEFEKGNYAKLLKNAEAKIKALEKEQEKEDDDENDIEQGNNNAKDKLDKLAVRLHARY